MSTYEDSYKSQLQGVSQQIARERLDGQVTAQDNMLSDTVTNLRRRPGTQFAYSLAVPTANSDSVLAWDTNISGIQCQVVLDVNSGTIRVLNSTYAVVASLPASTYLVTPTANIQVATVGDEFFICNTAVKPVAGAAAAGTSSADRGFFYIKAGAFSKSYDVTVQTSIGSATVSFTTPNGTSAGDAALANPDNIALQLVNSINTGTGTHGVTATRDTSYVYLSTSFNAHNLAVSTAAGINYLITSGNGYLRASSDLPSRLPAAAAGYIISTGELRSLQYYQYDATRFAWLETGDTTSPLTLTGMPISITAVGGVWSLATGPYEGRFAGDDDSNPDPAFLTQGITGMASYQGRLVLLSGALVNLSASNKPRRFYRSTVTSLLDSDCIEVGASAASSAAWRYAVGFDKDLLLFSEKYQGVMSGSQTAITPRTASVVVTSTYDADMTSRPIGVGRSVMYSVPRSKTFFGVMEMLPSQYADAKYISYDSTAHLPKYMAGRCRFSMSSSGANMVLFAPTNDRNSLIINEYTWQGDAKVQQAWHKWTFKYPVAAAYFSGQLIHLLFVRNGLVVGCTLDPRSGASNAASELLAKLDMNVFVQVVNRVVQLPAWLIGFNPDTLPDISLAVATGPLAGEPVGATAAGGVLTTDQSFTDGTVCMGYRYRSTFSPTPPMKKDYNGVKISTNKLTILRFILGTKDSAAFDVSVQDSTMTDPDLLDESPLYYSSNELELGQARVAGDSTTVIPARTQADSTSLVISTDGLGELNVVSLEFVAKYNSKIRRTGGR